MYKFFLIFLLYFTFHIEATTRILVSIAPQKFLVQSIGGDTVTVDLLVPPGANSHTYEPTLKQTLAAQKGEIWFRIGESFETRLISILVHTRIIDQREGLDLIQAGCGCCSHEGYDPHIWLSPALLKIQATQIAEVLSEYNPHQREFYLKNLSCFLEVCDALQNECASLLKTLSKRVVLVSHPAFGYFCREFNLEQLSIESEGREPTPRFLTELIKEARSSGLKQVFLQKQYNPKGGMRVAQEIGAEVIYIDPYDEDVIHNLRTIAKLFAHACH